MVFTASAKIFTVLSLGTFAGPFLGSWGSYPVSDLVTAATWFALVLCVQIGGIAIVQRKTSHRITHLIWPLAMLVLNLFFFTFVVTNWSRYEFAGYVMLYVSVFLIACWSSNGLRIAVTYLTFQLVIGSGANLLLPQDQDTNNTPIRHQEAGRSIYVIGIDGLVSREAKKVLFNSPPGDAYDWLTANGFQLYDAVSPGDQTLTTFGSLLRGTSDVHPRTVRLLFNGTTSSPLYDLLRAYGYRRQFFFENDYFGVGPGAIEDFRPTTHTFALCKFLDDRWGFFACRVLNRFTMEQSGPHANVQRNIEFYKSNVRVGSREKWFSISHIWYPGHTMGAYDGADVAQREAFIRYYNAADANLKLIFVELVSFIRSRDPNAGIVFMGDHGAYVLRSKTHFSVEGRGVETLRTLDSRSVLWAIYPAHFCRDAVQNLKDSSRLLMTLANCAASER